MEDEERNSQYDGFSASPRPPPLLPFSSRSKSTDAEHRHVLVKLLDKLTRPSLALARRRRLTHTRRIASGFLILIVIDQLRLCCLALPRPRLKLLLVLLLRRRLLVLHRRELVLVLLLLLVLLVRVGEGVVTAVVVSGVGRVALHRCWLL